MAPVPTPTRRRYVKLSEAAEYLQVTTRTVSAMIADGRLTGYKSGTRLVRVDLDEIDSAMRPFGGAVAANAGEKTSSQARRRRAAVKDRLAELDGGAA